MRSIVHYGQSAMVRQELNAASIWRPALRDAYTRCRQLNAMHGRTYFLATRLLPPARRPAIHALYGFARWIDDIVDRPSDRPSVDRSGIAAAELDEAETALRAAVSDPPGPPWTDRGAILAALVDTIRRYRIDPTLLHSFLSSMRMDLTVTEYPTRAALESYTYGSASVIGLETLPVLGTVVPREEAAPHASALGHAFQLTNFLRDVGEDLDRGRVYLPADELAAFGVDRDRLLWCRRAGHADRRVRQALADQVARTRAVYRRAQPGIAMLHAVSRPCVSTAYTLYGEILDRIVESGYDVFGRRLAVSRTRRVAVAAPAAAAALTARVVRR